MAKLYPNTVPGQHLHYTRKLAWMNNGQWMGHNTPNGNKSHFVLAGTTAALCGTNVPRGELGSSAGQCQRCRSCLDREMRS